MSAPVPDRLPPALRVADGAFGLLALWTLCANVAVALGLGLDALIATFTAVTVAAFLVWRRRRAGGAANEAHASDPSSTATAAAGPSSGTRAIGAGGALTAIALLHATGDLRAFWLVSFASLALLLLREQRAEGGDAGAAAGGDAYWLFAVAALCALLASVAHRPDADDALYLNLAAAAAANPSAALLAHDTLHGIEGLPLTLPVYRLHSLELLWAAVARGTGVPVIDVAHALTPAVAGALVPLALARLLRQLLPDRWSWALGCALALLVLAGGALHGYGSFGFVRLQQGKAILVSAAVPLIAAHALAWARHPSPSGWLALAGSQIAGVGLSATGLWLGPVVAGLALLAARPLRLARPRTLALGACASLHPIIAGLALRERTSRLFAEGVARGEFPAIGDRELAHSILEPVLGPDPFASLALATVLLAPAFAPTAAARRFCGVFALGLLLLWNPFVANAIAGLLTGPGTYWRIAWLLPLPVVFACLATAATRSPLRALPPAALGSAAAVAVLLVARAGPVVGPGSDAHWALPGRRIPAQVLPLRRAVLEHTRAGDAVLLPLDVAPWVVADEAAPAPLVVRADYLGVLRARLGASELERRVRLARLVSGEAALPRAGHALARSLAEDDLRAVALAPDTAQRAQLERVLREAGFERVHESRAGALWVRSDAGAGRDQS